MLPLVTFALCWPLAGDPSPSAADEAELSEAIGIHELKAHVYHLASREFLGRRGPGAARVAQHLAQSLRRLHLQPAFGDSYFQPIPLASADQQETSFVGRNVAAVLPGADPGLRDEWVLLSAHFDHLGGTETRWFPGADDNASGIAMLLEVAEHFALAKSKPRRTIVFVAFDQEEAGLLGSKHFAAHPPRDIKQLKAFLTADMIGRSMVNLMDEYVFILGSESSPALRRLIQTVKPPDGLIMGRLGTDIIGTRSDYGPFRERRIPFLFFSTGQHPDYHQPNDLPDRIDYAKLQKICLLIAELTRRLADDDTTPLWEEEKQPDLEEARTALILIGRVLEHPQVFPLSDKQRLVVVGVHEKLATIVKTGSFTKEERTWLAFMAKLLLATVF